MLDAALIDSERLLGIVRLDAADIVGGALHEGGHEGLTLRADAVARCGGRLLVVSINLSSASKEAIDCFQP